MPRGNLPFNPIPTWEQSNPVLAGFGQSQQMYGQMLQNALKQNEAQYAQPNSQQALQQAMLQNQYYGPNMESEIGLRGAQTGLAGQQSKMVQFQMEHPELFGQSPAAMLEWLKKNGVDVNSQLGNGGFSGAGMNDQFQESQSLGGALPSPGSNQVGMPPTMGGQGQPMQNQMPGMQTGIGSNPNSFMQSYLRKNLIGSELDPYQQAGLELQKNIAQSEIPLRTERINQASQIASTAASTKQNVAKFLNNYEKANFKGPGSLSGGVSTSGISGGIASAFGYDLTPEVEMDQASAALQTDLIPKFQGKMTQGEFEFLSNLKLYREMPKQAAKDTGELLNAGADRAAEYQRFLTTGINKGYPVSAIDTAWTQYINQRPMMNLESGKVNRDFMNTGKDFLDPKAVRAWSSGQPYQVINDRDIEYTAKKYNVTPDEVRKRLQDGGHQ